MFVSMILYDGHSSSNFEITLQLTISQSVCQGIESTLGLAIKYYFLSEGCFLKFALSSLWGALSDERSSLSFVFLSLVIINIYIKHLRYMCFTVQQFMYNKYKASIIPAWVQQIMLY
jgi:hypothetical protein